MYIFFQLKPELKKFMQLKHLQKSLSLLKKPSGKTILTTLLSKKLAKLKVAGHFNPEFVNFELQPWIFQP